MPRNKKPPQKPPGHQSLHRDIQEKKAKSAVTFRDEMDDEEEEQMVTVDFTEQIQRRLMEMVRDEDDDEAEEALEAGTDSELSDDEDFDAALDGEGADLDGADADAFGAFFASDRQSRRTLAETIAASLAKHETKKPKSEKKGVSFAAQEPRGMDDDALIRRAAQDEIQDKAVQRVFKAIGMILKRYTVGPLPKAFRLLPLLERWQELILLTDPAEWSPCTILAATRIFTKTTTTNDNIAQAFFQSILLPLFRAQVRREDTARLHSMYYRAIRLATYRPAAFFRGFLFPLACSTGNDDEDEFGACTLREATIVASMMKIASFPARHAAVAIITISSFPCNPSTVLLLRTLIEKGYDLPYKAIDAVGAHFWGFYSRVDPVRDGRLPVAWHQSLLAFISRYGSGLLPAQIVFLRRLVERHKHPLISPEILKELARAAATATR